MDFLANFREESSSMYTSFCLQKAITLIFAPILLRFTPFFGSLDHSLKGKSYSHHMQMKGLLCWCALSQTCCKTCCNSTQDSFTSRKAYAVLLVPMQVSTCALHSVSFSLGSRGWKKVGRGTGGGWIGPWKGGTVHSILFLFLDEIRQHRATWTCTSDLVGTCLGKPHYFHKGSKETNVPLA